MIDELKSNRHGISWFGYPPEVHWNPELTSKEKILFGIIYSLSLRREGCTASNYYLGRVMMCNEQTITNGISKLKSYFYIKMTMKKTGGGTQRHIFINEEYPIIYKRLVQTANDSKNSKENQGENDSLGLKKELLRTIKNIIQPYKENYSAIYIDNNRDNNSYIFIKNKNITQCDSDESPNSSLPEDKQIRRRRRSPKPTSHRILPSIVANYWNTCPTVTTHRTGTDKYKRIIHLLGQLLDGKFTQGRAFDKKWRTLIPDEYFAGKKWTIKELKKVVHDLTLYSQEGYWPKDKRNFKSLPELLYNSNTGKSMFFAAAAKPPQPLSERRMPIKDKQVGNLFTQLTTTLELSREEVDKYSSALIQTAKDLKAYFLQRGFVNDKRGRYVFPTCEAFVGKYTEFINNNWPSFKEDKIGIQSRVFKDFEGI
jgi:hypothetical protein